MKKMFKKIKRIIGYIYEYHFKTREYIKIRIGCFKYVKLMLLIDDKNKILYYITTAKKDKDKEAIKTLKIALALANEQIDEICKECEIQLNI